VLSIVGLAIAGSLGAGMSTASAQAIIVDPYVDAYPVVVAPPAIVARPPVVAPIVRERTIVVSRPAYAVPAWGMPVPRFGYPIGAGYPYPDW
jgi:hypothetical protein